MTVPFEIVGNEFSVSGGARVYAQPLDARVRAFAEMSAGWLRSSGEFTLLGFSESGSDSGFSLSPGGGVDFRLGDRITYRLAGRFPVRYAGGARSTSLGLVTGFVFRFPG